MLLARAGGQHLSGLQLPLLASLCKPLLVTSRGQAGL